LLIIRFGIASLTCYIDNDEGFMICKSREVKDISIDIIDLE